MQNDETKFKEDVVPENSNIVFVGLLAEAEKRFSNANKIDLKGKKIYKQ